VRLDPAAIRQQQARPDGAGVGPLSRKSAILPTDCGSTVTSSQAARRRAPGSAPARCFAARP